MMTCRDITELVTDYLEGRMGWSEWVRFQFHLGMCVHCRAYLRQMQTTVDTVGALEPEQIPDDVRDALKLRFKDWHAAGASADADPFEAN